MMNGQSAEMNDIIKRLGLTSHNRGVSTGIKSIEGSGDVLQSRSPVDGLKIADISTADHDDYELVVKKAVGAFEVWRMLPSPQRGEIVRQMGQRFRDNKHDLAMLVSYEMGKSLQEGLGEVQEMIDICDFAVGISRQLYGLTMHSERPQHRMYEQWHPLGVVGIISAFNFPVAVWSWNAMIALVCGDVCIWKPSEKTPLAALACQHIIGTVLEANEVPEGVVNLLIGGPELGQLLSQDRRVGLVSATGSTRMGKAVAEAVGRRLGRSLLELGGNNAIIVTPSANLDIAIPGIVFGAVGTAGQRCTSTRRVIIHEAIYEQVKERIKLAYGQLRMGNPLHEHVHVGPLIDKAAVRMYIECAQSVTAEGGTFLVKPKVFDGPGYESGCYVAPCVAEAQSHYAIVQQETFAPVLFLLKYSKIEEAIDIQNGVPHGLSSAIFTQNISESERFLAQSGSDCGIANVNIGTSGAEIGGAFGGEKESGGGRESGSDAWKSYMRRQTTTINYGNTLPLAQGIKFDIE
jgi:aldehyde dehydrogenase (NAD+)